MWLVEWIDERMSRQSNISLPPSLPLSLPYLAPLPGKSLRIRIDRHKKIEEQTRGGRATHTLVKQGVVQLIHRHQQDTLRAHGRLRLLAVGDATDEEH